MKFIHRLGFFLGGFSIGVVFLMFFLSGKKTSCAYGPNARVLKNINNKKIRFDNLARLRAEALQIDSVSVYTALRKGKVIFSDSNTQLDSCKVYTIQGKDLKLKVENCDQVAKILDLSRIN